MGFLLDLLLHCKAFKLTGFFGFKKKSVTIQFFANSVLPVCYDFCYLCLASGVIVS